MCVCSCVLISAFVHLCLKPTQFYADSSCLVPVQIPMHPAEADHVGWAVWCLVGVRRAVAK